MTPARAALALSFASAFGISACGAPSPLAGGPNTAEDEAFVALLTAFDAGDCDRVITLVEGLETSSALRLHTAEMLYGRCLAMKGDDATALLVLDRVADVEPPDPATREALYHRGLVRIALADHAGAASDFERFGARFPYHHHADDAAYHLGLARLTLGELEAAERAFLALLAMPRASRLRLAGATYRLGLTGFERAADDPSSPDLEAAWARFAEVLDRYPDTTYVDGAAYRMGRVRFAQTRYDESAALFASFVADHPDSAYLTAAAYYEARSLDEQGDLEAAITRYDAVRALGDSWADDAAFRAGHARLALAEQSGAPSAYAAAENALSEALAAYPASPWITSLAYDLGRARYALERFSAAIEAFARVIAVPTSVFADNAVYYTGRCWYRIAFRDAPESYATAATWFERLVRDYPTSSYADDATYFLGRARFELGDLEAAIAAFEDLVATFGDSNYVDDALHYLVLAWLGRADCDAAAAALAEFRALTPDSPALPETEAAVAARCPNGGGP